MIVVLNMIGELGFAGANDYTLWGLIANALCIVILYALIVRWDDATRDLPAPEPGS